MNDDKKNLIEIGYRSKDGRVIYYADKESRDDIRELKKAISYIKEQDYILTYDDIAHLAKKSDLFSKSYNDLTDKPVIPSIIGLASKQWVLDKNYLTEHQDISHLAEKSELFSGSYNDLKDKPAGLSLEGYATEQWVLDRKYLTSHQNISHLAEKSELFSGSYNDLTDKPTIPSLDGYVREEWVLDKNYLTEHQDISHLAPFTYVDEKISSIVGGAPETLDTLKELSDALNNESNFAVRIATEVGKKLNKSTFQKFLDDVASSYAKRSELFSGSYNDLKDKPEIPSVEGLASEDWVKNQNYLTEHQKLDDFVTKEFLENYIEQKMNEIAVIQEVMTEEEMNALLTSNNVGKVYRFVGTTGTYINGDLYEVVRD